MNAIPIVQTSDKDVNQLQQNLKQALDPVIQNPIVSGNILQRVLLKSGQNVINHGLGRALQGWGLVRKRSQAGIYDTQDSNQNPSATLQLVSDANVSVDIYVF